MKTFDEKRLFTLSKDLLNGHYQGTDESKVADLLQVLRFHEWKYAVLNAPVISDFEYDSLYKMLEHLEQSNPSLVDPDSPTQRVTSDSTSDFETVAHLTPMLSLANSYNREDLKSYEESLVRILKEHSEDLTYVAEPKFDGGTIVLVYENDRLVRAATRGNGERGDNITANARTLRSIPLQAAFSSYGIVRCELRGEAIIAKSSFEEINKLRLANGEQPFANPRNAATGGLRMKVPADAAKRGIEVFVFQVSMAEYTDDATVLDRHWAHINMLEHLGFKVPQSGRKQCKTIDDVADFTEEWEGQRDNYAYEVDGMVVKVDSLALQDALGATSHHPRWAIAYKFKARQATSKLIAVEYQVGKIGSITPVAKLEPVQVAGVTVSSVSLHNEDFIMERDLHIGDQVLVERAGDVIPYIVKAFPELRDGSEAKITFPKNCPINLQEEVTLVRVEQEAAWRCPACSCGAQPLQRMIFHVSKPAMNIDGFGRSIVERFHQMGWVQSLSDIYNLDYELIKELEGFGERSAEKLRRSIDKAKQNPIHRLLHSLSIHHLGERGAKIIAGQILHVLELEKWTEEDFTELKDIGPVVAQNVAAYFSVASNVADLRRMEEYGVNLKQTGEDRPKEQKTDGKFSGKTILFTGTLTHMTRAEARALAESQGAQLISGVSKKLNILVVGEKAGSKLRKAEALGTVEIIDEASFAALVQDE